MYDFSRYLNIRSANHPYPSPDGTRVVFLSDITGNFQAWSTSTSDNSWPVQLTFFPDKVWEIYGTHATDHLLAVSDVGGNERQQFYLISNYGSSGSSGTPHDVKRLTPNDDAIHRFGAWSSDGQQIIYTSNERNNVDFDAYRMDIETGETTLLAAVSGNRMVVGVSPDETQLLVLDAYSSLQIDLYLLDLQTGEERPLTADAAPARYWGFNWVASGLYCITDRSHDCGAICRFDLETGDITELVSADLETSIGELELFQVAPDGQTAVFTYNVEGYSHLYQFDLVTHQYALYNRLTEGVIHSLDFSADSRTLFFDLDTATQNVNVYALTLGEAEGRQLTFSNQAGIDPLSFVSPELIRYESFDGLQIPAFLYLPHTQPANSNTSYPCILYVHGGPASQLRPEFDVRFQYFLNHGYAILATNVRGSTGYGREYTGLDELELRMNSVADLKHAVQYLHGRDEIDNGRIVIYGRSYGGFMVLAAMTEYPELFAAGIDVVGIANWVTFMERTSPWRRPHREREYGSLENHRDLLEHISPIHKIERIQVPLMVIAGDNDPRVPLYESELVVDQVRAAGGTVEFLHYADEGHKISKLNNRIDSFTRMGEFLDRHV
ncbi:MAG: S9 family peptidase [Chloroflexota bacterium]